MAGGAPYAVHATGLSKRYRLYHKPVYRLLDLFGLCPAAPNYYSEHAALKDVDLMVGRGEKVAIIGRNGAGKSTLLKIITGLVRPSSGSVDVRGQVSNLLQIGSGFHPDFTGRQNVFASLAHQGITGPAASRLFDEILAFAEIEEYIDQPMKTYSTGMCSRLMFASSVVVKPDILIVDEILGVGDAYFSHKSFERMRELCSGDGCTLLLVTNDIYSAQNLCDRFVWIDRGVVKYDGDAKTAVAMYETSVKEQEEVAGRQRAVAAVTEVAERTAVPLRVAVRSPTGFALQRPLGLSAIEIVDASGSVERLDVAAPPPPSWHMVAENNLGPIESLNGRACRVLRTYGSIYHKAEWIVTLPPAARPVEARVQWSYGGADAAEFVVFRGEREQLVKAPIRGGAGWQDGVFTFGSASAPGELVQTEFGSGLVRIMRTRLLDAAGEDVDAVKHGDPLVIRFDLEVNRADIRSVSFVLGFTRHGTSFAVNVVNHALSLPASGESVVDVRLPAVRLGSGTWFLRVGIAEANVFKQGDLRYFALEDRWYHLMREGVRFDVLSVDQLDASGCFMVHDGQFVVRAASDAHESPVSGQTVNP